MVLCNPREDFAVVLGMNIMPLNAVPHVTYPLEGVEIKVQGTVAVGVSEEKLT
jgi:hypothetical protein